MRIEIDDELGKLLDTVKAKEPAVYGRGHADTVRFLIRYYTQHKPIAELVKSTMMAFETFLVDFDGKITDAMRRSIFQALGDAIGTLGRSAAAVRETAEVR